MNTAKIALKQVLTNAYDEPFKDVDAVKEKIINDGGKERSKTIEELIKEAPDLTLGQAFVNILLSSATPDNPEESAKQNRYAKRMKNILRKGDDGFLEVDIDDLEKLSKFLKNVKMIENSASIIGEIQNAIEQAYVDIKASELKKEIQ